jgi:hypothetical protein
LGKRKKSQGASSGEQGRWGMIVVFVEAKNWRTSDIWAGPLSALGQILLQCTTCLLSSSDKIQWHVPYDSPTMLQTSWIVRRWPSTIASHNFATFSVVVLVEGRPECSSSSTDIRQFFKCLNHS